MGNMEIDDTEEMSFADLFNAEELVVVSVGDVVEGTVVDLNDNCAIVDCGDKSESEIMLHEFKHDGEQVEV